ncbi:hypothetical protein ACFORH_10835 [Amycolatopsis roodepoortensis]|uniref:Uncharacterized protein n=1 Tax=Amycolatopsis roodepoortensis TaxID=700274 RepID=A0ABR9LAG8_9PSEU|nr:hypothetical protein [Amycolatopsis roodepoortensis]MBE1577673.1 hypothetical protein [Amycolatopsis roodepoortensis]
MYQLCNAQQVYAKGPDTEISLSNADRLREAHADYVRRMKALKQVAHSQPAAYTREAPLTGTAAAAQKQWPELSRSHAIKIANSWTRDFTPAATAAWWGAGLNHSEVSLAQVLEELGIRPEHLPAQIRGETILYRLKEGVQPERVLRILQTEGLM